MTISRRKAHTIRWAIGLARGLARYKEFDYVRACEGYAPFENPTYTARVLRECFWRAFHPTSTRHHKVRKS